MKYKFEDFLSEDIKNKKLVASIMDNMEDIVVEICRKFETGNVNHASLPAFWMAVQGDIDSAIEREIKEIQKP